MSITVAPISTQLFRFITPADPQSVWRMLTPAGGQPCHFYGMVATSEWVAGSTVELGDGGGTAIVGEVLVAEPCSRLTHSLGDRLDAPSTYVTWEIDGTESGTVVRLYIDEIDPIDDGPDERMAIEAAWLPVLATLQSELARCAW